MSSLISRLSRIHHMSPTEGVFLLRAALTTVVLAGAPASGWIPLKRKIKVSVLIICPYPLLQFWTIFGVDTCVCAVPAPTES